MALNAKSYMTSQLLDFILGVALNVCTKFHGKSNCCQDYKTTKMLLKASKSYPIPDVKTAII